MIRTLMVEDEPLARDLLRSYIALHPDIDLVGEAANGLAAIQMIQELAPDLLLLDIALPECSGLEVLRSAERSPAVIFITAFDEHAITAFELGAFDYLLKPFSADRFAQALARIRERLTPTDGEPSLRERVDGPSQEYLQRLFVRHLGITLPVYAPDIVRLEADDDYTAIYANGRRMLVHLPLGKLEGRLDPKEFVRVHRSSIINLAHVRSSEQSERRVVLCMSDGVQVTSSRARTAILNAMFFQTKCL